MFLGITLLVISYLIGSIPFGLLFGKLSGKDLRKHGSGNIGSTNAVRVLGKKLGLLSAACDILKGAIIVLVVYLLEATTKWSNPFVINCDNLYALYGLAAVLGHCFSIYLKLKGGKAVATSLGVLISVVPWSALAALIGFGVILILTGFVSLGSTVATLCACATVWGVYGGIYGQWFSCCVVSIFGVIIILKHIPNYKRLIKGTENSFKKKKRTKSE